MKLATNIGNLKHHLLNKLIFMSVLTISFLFIWFLTSLRQWYFINSELHTAVECIGSLAAVFLGLIVVYDADDSGHNKWIGFSIYAMGLFDIIHAVLPPGNSFVFIHNLALVSGSVGYALCGIRQKEIRKLTFPVLMVITLYCIIMCVMVIKYPEIIPRMLDESALKPEMHEMHNYQYVFSKNTIIINFTAAFLYLTGVAQLVAIYRKRIQIKIMLLILLGFFSVIAGFNFPFSHLWSNKWWFWHGARFFIYLITWVIVWVRHITVAEKLRINEERFDFAMRGASDGLWDMDFEKGTTYWSPRLLEMLGFTIDEIKPDLSNWYTLINPVERQSVKRKIETYLENGSESIRLEYGMVNKLGKVVDVLLRGFTLRSSDNKAIRFVATLSDITERNIYREQIEQKNIKLETMLHIASHDLREPLRAIRAFSRILMKQYSKDYVIDSDDYLKRIEKGAERLEQLIEDIVTVSNAQRQIHNKETVNGRVLVDGALRKLSWKINETDALITVDDPFPQLYVDKTWAVTAIEEVIDNALKFTADDTPPEIQIKAYLRKGFGEAGIMISDRGTGVPVKYMAKIFKLFQRAVPRSVPGTGAGLAITKQIVENHSGKVWFEARKGGGTTFIITFGKIEKKFPDTKTMFDAKRRKKDI